MPPSAQVPSSVPVIEAWMSSGRALRSRPAVQFEPDPVSHPPDGVKAHNWFTRNAAAVTSTGSGPSAETAAEGNSSRNHRRPVHSSTSGLTLPVPVGTAPPTAQVHPGIAAADATANIPVECDGTEIVATARHPLDPIARLAGRPAAAGPAPATASTAIVAATRTDPVRGRFIET